MKVVINQCHGGFGLSPMAIKRYFELKGVPIYFYIRPKSLFRKGINDYIRVNPEDANEKKSLCVYTLLEDVGERVSVIPQNVKWWYGNGIDRNDKLLVQVVEEMGKDASDEMANLHVVEIPDNINYEIEEYDGYESIHETHRSWG
jgi:hypothetical protein